MSNEHGTASDSTRQTPWKDARGTLRRLRQQLQAHAHLPQVAEDDGSLIEESAVTPGIAELPEALQRLLHAYRKRHPDVVLEPIYYFASDSVNARTKRPQLADLPDEDNLVVLTCSESAVDVTDVEVHSHVLLLRRRTKE